MARDDARVARDECPDSGAVLSAWYLEHAAGVYRFALHLAGCREDAEDVVQFAFLQAHRALASGSEITNPRAWLMTTAKRRWLTTIRDRHDVPVDPTVITDATPAVSGAAAASELASVRASLWTLPEAQHQAFVLRHWSGLSQDEIAQVLGITQTAVESLLARARGALVADRDATGICRDVRERLAAGNSHPNDDAHTRSCRRCRVAKQRLSTAMSIATVLSLAPRQHVADALASTIPGFTATGITASAGSTVAVSGLGSVSNGSMLATGAGKLAAAVKLATTVAAIATVTSVVHTAAFHEVTRILARPIHAAIGITTGATAPRTTQTSTPGAAGRANAHAHGGRAIGKGAGHTHHPGTPNGQHKGPTTSRTSGSNSGSSSHGKANGQTRHASTTSTAEAGTTNSSGSSSHGKVNAKANGTAKTSSTGSTTTAAHGNGKNRGNGRSSRLASWQ